MTKHARLLIGFLCLITSSLPGPVVNAQEIVPGWKTPAVVSETCCAAWTAPLVDPWGGMHLFWADKEPYIIYSRWDRERWIAPVDIIKSPATGPAVHVRAAASPDGFLHLIWGTTAGGPLFYSRAWVEDAGNPHAWSSPEQIADRMLGGDIKVDPMGRIHLVYSEIADGEGPRHRVLDPVSGWAEPKRLESPLGAGFTAADTRLAIASDGTLHLVWSSNRMPNAYPEHNVYYERSADGGETWSDFLQLDTLPPEVESDTQSNFKNKMPNVVVGSGSDVHVTWHQHTGFRYHKWSKDGGLTWEPSERVFPDMGAAFNGPVDMAFDSSGRMHVVATRASVWYRSWTQDLRWSPPLLVDPNSPDWHHHRVAVFQGNQLFLFYPDINGTGFMWFTRTKLDVPEIAVSPLPLRVATPSTEVTNTEGARLLEPAATATVFQAAQVATAAVPSRRPSAQFVALLGALPALALVAAVVIVRLLRKGRA